MTDESREASANAIAQKMWASAITEAGYWRFEETAIIELGKAVIERTARIIDDLRARLATVEQERDKLKEDDIQWQEIAGMVQEALTFAGQKGRATPPMNFDDAIRKIARERDAALAEVKALRERPSDAVADIEEADIAPNESEVNNAGEFLDHWFGEGKWPPVHKLDVILATYANAFALIARAALDAKEKP